MVEACGEAECDEAGAEVCFRGGMCVDLDQSWACNCAWGGDFGEDLADVFDGAGALYGFDVVERGGDEGNGAAGEGGGTHCMRIIVAPDKFKDCLRGPKGAEAIGAGGGCVGCDVGGGFWCMRGGGGG